MIQWTSVALFLSIAVTTIHKVDLTLQEIDQALVIARASENERTRFHAPYIKKVESAFVERVELVTEFRRVVLLAEEHIGRGERAFAYSTTRANEALKVWKRRVSVIARVRFHPQNNYVTLPSGLSIVATGQSSALVGSKSEPIYAFAEKGQHAPIAGAIVEGSFSSDALGQGEHEFVVFLDARELGRAKFDLAAVD